MFRHKNLQINFGSLTFFFAFLTKTVNTSDKLQVAWFKDLRTILYMYCLVFDWSVELGKAWTKVKDGTDSSLESVAETGGCRLELT